MLKKCSICSKKFEAYRSGKLCSDECRKEKELQRNRARLKTESYREKQRLYREAHRHVAAFNQKVYYKNHEEEYKEKAKVRYEENPEPAKIAARIWAKNNKQRKAATDKAWAKANQDKVRSYQHKHRSAVQGNGGSYTPAEWTALCARYHNRCLDCDKRRKLTADHVIPVSKGGTSYISNIQPLCGPCNCSKGAKTIDFRSMACPKD